MTYGLRNPFTFAVQPVTGRIHINDVGQDIWEEVNVGAAGVKLYLSPAHENDPIFDEIKSQISLQPIQIGR